MISTIFHKISQYLAKTYNRLVCWISVILSAVICFQVEGSPSPSMMTGTTCHLVVANCAMLISTYNGKSSLAMVGIIGQHSTSLFALFAVFSYYKMNRADKL